MSRTKPVLGGPNRLEGKLQSFVGLIGKVEELDPFLTSSQAGWMVWTQDSFQNLGGFTVETALLLRSFRRSGRDPPGF
jgi:hypothetical protein